MMSLCIGGGLLITLVLAACGGGGGGGYGATGSSSNASAPAATTIRTATVMVGGMSEPVLTTAAGRTLYYFMPDSTHTVACTGSCAKTWPPLLTPASGAPNGSGLPGALGSLHDANGDQVVYNGHPLYTYSGDTAAGQAHGQGLLGKWFVATPNVAQNSGAAGGSSTPTPPPGY
jgi:predicted lipoprotein with Yx(FWY)xxD motif